MTLQPLRRDPSLVPLSHDHHDGLVAAVRLKKGRSAFTDESDPAASVARLWQEDLRPHFEQEERILFARQWPTEIGGMVEHALDEHRRIRSLVERVTSGDGPPELIPELGSLLEQHIRFEERQLFGAMQNALSPEQLAAIGVEIAAMRQPKICRTRGE